MGDERSSGGALEAATITANRERPSRMTGMILTSLWASFFLCEDRREEQGLAPERRLLANKGRSIG